MQRLQQALFNRYEGKRKLEVCSYLFDFHSPLCQILTPRNVQTVKLTFKGHKTAKAVGHIAAGGPHHLARVDAVLVQKDFQYTCAILLASPHPSVSLPQRSSQSTRSFKPLKSPSPSQSPLPATGPQSFINSGRSTSRWRWPRRRRNLRSRCPPTPTPPAPHSSSSRFPPLQVHDAVTLTCASSSHLVLDWVSRYT